MSVSTATKPSVSPWSLTECRRIVDPSAAQSGAYEGLITFFDQPTTNSLLRRTVAFMNS